MGYKRYLTSQRTKVDISQAAQLGGMGAVHNKKRYPVGMEETSRRKGTETMQAAGTGRSPS
jgi:hypothetical protein